MTGAEPQPLGGYLSVLKDFEGRLDFEAIRHADADFVPSPADNPAFGYHPGTIWLRFQLTNPTGAHQSRWLEQGWIFQEHVDLYLLDGAGHVTGLRNGAGVPKDARPLPSQAILFPIDLAPGENLTAYLALSGRASSTVKLTLWQPVAYADAGRLRMAIKYLALGSSLLVVVFSFMAWQARRTPLLLLGGLGELLILPNMMVLDGFAFGLLPAGPGLWQTRVSTLLAGLYFACHTLFARAFFDLPGHAPRLDRALRWLAGGMALFTVAGVALRDPRFVVLPILVTMLVLTWVAFTVSRRGAADARAYLGSWSLLWLTVAFRMLQLLGWTPLVSALIDVHVLGLVASGLALAYALFLNARAVRAEADAARAALMLERAEENARLEAAVRAQTLELRTAKERAEAGNQAKTAFLSMMSHELRAPLHTIIGYSQLLAGGAEPELRRRLGVVERNGRELLHLIDGILHFSRNERPPAGQEPRPVSLAELGQRLVESHRPSASQRGNQLSLRMDPALPEWVEADETPLAQALGNLVGNACKYTENGHVTLAIERAGTSAEEEAGGAGPMDRVGVRFAVADNGPGIPPGSEAAIFAPFHRVNPNGDVPGAGLGLSIAQQLVNALGGRIEYQRPPHGVRGSLFSFELALAPCPSAGAGDDSDAALDIVGYDGPCRTLLIADDNDENRFFLAERCKRWGFSVLEAKSGEEALRQARASPVPIAAALVDQFMPGGDGWAFLRGVRESGPRPDLPVVLISASPAQRPGDFPAGLDFDAIVLKPLLRATLAKLLETLLGIQWRRAPRPAAAPPMPDALARTRLPGAEIEQFRAMVSLGRIHALREWTQRMARDYPDGAAAMGEIDGLCDTLDLAGLARIAADWTDATEEPG